MVSDVLEIIFLQCWFLSSSPPHQSGFSDSVFGVWSFLSDVTLEISSLMLGRVS